ncbi:hypothetical protein [Shinella zoogloeoides]|uniref:hypothetical protein n=1 Tax=Shinella zoogloeoides TaxID=352475 RepID=UPI0028AAAD4C|nr:hypothetical protein [Shinella zoogloeoides]
MLRYLGVVAAAGVLMVTTAEAKKASCLVPHSHDRTRKFMSFDIDDTKPPYIFNVNGIDRGSSKEDLVDIPPYSKETAKFQTWYYSNVTMEVDRQQTKFSIAFGEPNASTYEFVPWDRYALYVNWEHGTAGWLDEGGMYNIFDILEKMPNVVAYPASCRRLD